MRFIFPLLVAAAGFVSAQPGNPAPMNGIWQLIQVNENGSSSTKLSQPAGQLFIVSGNIRGNYGCGRYEGTIEAARNVVHITADPLPPKPTERCLYAVRGAFHADLTAATQYTLSRNHLVLFSKSARLTFERIGYVTPAKK
ncbi:META domain-containing protein [Deinococcus sp. KNUC1210]|uniref:META domain-containing protein n=1 Tax=Deinococcus sp. KNUC1210 TaxID=2917691 RepID=UPI001EF0FDB5|nr:META domain-containing protein [Deinococcus sp. KNUC1210]ULH16038.1 META domain-containing protein [Deinococcus sp. KNUC1210]